MKFSIYSLVLVSHFPHWWKELTQYKLPILHTHHHLSGHVWFNYYQDFCEHSAVTKLANWLLLILANFPAFRAHCFIPQPCETCHLGSLSVINSWHRFAFACLPTDNLAALQELIVARHFRRCHTRCHLESMIGKGKGGTARSRSSFFFLCLL